LFEPLHGWITSRPVEMAGEVISMDLASLKSLSVLDLLALHSGILDELRRRSVLRTANNPVADYAELLVCSALSLTPAPNSEKGYDATDSDGRRYEIKARRQTKRSKPTRFSAIRGLEEGHFDYLVAVLFKEDFRIHRAAILTPEAVAKRVFWQKHVNGWILPLNDSLWNDSVLQDITARLQEIQW
jgi:hypothetical protein